MAFIFAKPGQAESASTGAAPHNGVWHPLSSIQRSFWFQYRLRPEMQGSSNLAFCIRVSGRLDLDRLSRALNLLAARHPMLRARFREIDGEPEQCIEPMAEVPIEVFDARGLDDPSVQKWVAGDYARPFDLTSAPLMRAKVYRQDDGQHVLLLVFDHLICDGWSFWRLIEELGEILEGSGASFVPDPPVEQSGYFDYVREQREWLSSAKAQKQLAYWSETLRDECPVLNLPEAKSWSLRQFSQRETIPFVLPAELASNVKSLAGGHRCSVYMVLLAAYFALLHRLTGEEHISVGSLMPARGGGRWECVVGPFINLVGLRVTFDATLTVAGLLGKVRSTVLRAMMNQDYPFTELVERSSPHHSRGQHPYFQTLFGFHNPRGAAKILELIGSDKDSVTVRWGCYDAAPFWRAPSNGGEAYGLALDMAEFGCSIGGRLNYATEMFDARTALRYISYYKRILAGMAASDAGLVCRLPLLGADERERLLSEWAPSPVEYADRACVHDLIEAQAACTPGAIAVMWGEVAPDNVAQDEFSLTYGELNARADMLANALRNARVRPGSLVGVCANRSLGMLVALLAVWKAGAAYVPLDPSYPAARLAVMLEDSAPTVVLVDGAGKAAVEAARFEIEASRRGVTVLDLMGEWAETPSARAALAASTPGEKKPGLEGRDPRSLAYVIYTSGSTGKPKGVMVEHGAVVNVLWSLRTLTGFGAADRMLALTSIGFDIAGVELWLPLLCGGRTVLAAPAASRDPALLSKTLEQSEITVLQATPATWQMLVDWGWRGRAGLKALSGGEALAWELASRLRGRVGFLWNMYGPSETTIWSTAWEAGLGGFTATVETGGFVPLGLPLANTRIYVLDAAGEPVPPGVTGEIYIGGAGVARGYLNRAEQTSERFSTDPFTPRAAGRIYRTGDLGRRLGDGTLGFVGRNDFQVKVRGFRIELGEIEARILAHPGVGTAIVVAREDRTGGRYLAVYYTATADSSVACPEAKDLRAHIGMVLPEYMVPMAYVRMEHMPLTPNGKLDRQALPAPAAGTESTAATHAAPAGRLEEVLAIIWAKLLKARQVGRQDDFFALGGNSLLAVRLITRIREELKLDVPPATLFAHPSLVDFAAAIEAAAAGSGTSIANPHIIGFCDSTAPRLDAPPAIFGIAEALIFMPLAKHLGGGGQPFFVLRALESELPQINTCRTLEDIASFYVELLRGAQPDGPYILLGFCSEGVLAFEMARQLGSQAALVIIVDAWAPGHYQRLGLMKGTLTNLSYRWRRKLWHLQRPLPGVSFARRLLYILQLAPTHAWMKRQFARLVLQERDSAPARIHDHIDTAAKHYRPRLNECSILLIRGENQPQGPLISPTLGWDSFAASPVAVAKVPGDHDEMFAEPNVQEMARTFIESVNATRSFKVPGVAGVLMVRTGAPGDRQEVKAAKSLG